MERAESILAPSRISAAKPNGSGEASDINSQPLSIGDKLLSALEHDESRLYEDSAILSPRTREMPCLSALFARFETLFRHFLLVLHGEDADLVGEVAVLSAAPAALGSGESHKVLLRGLEGLPKKDANPGSFTGGKKVVCPGGFSDGELVFPGFFAGGESVLTDDATAAAGGQLAMGDDCDVLDSGCLGLAQILSNSDESSN
jgi:hypothetical protein